MAETTTTTTNATLAEAIREWGLAHVPADALPAPEALDQIPKAIAAIAEYLLDPLGRAIAAIDDADSAAIVADEKGRGQLPWPLPEDQRVLSWADYGRLTALVDDLRGELSILFRTLQNLGLHVHEDARLLASGRGSDFWDTEEFRSHRLRELGLEAAT